MTTRAESLRAGASLARRARAAMSRWDWGRQRGFAQREPRHRARPQKRPAPVEASTEYTVTDSADGTFSVMAGDREIKSGFTSHAAAWDFIDRRTPTAQIDADRAARIATAFAERGR